MKTNFKKFTEITNSEEDRANIWNHHYQVSQDSQSLKAADQSQSVEKFQSISTKNSSTQIKFREYLWTAASKRVSNKRIEANREQLWTAASKKVSN